MTVPQMCQFKPDNICPNAAIFGEILKSVRMELDEHKRSSEAAIAQNRAELIITVAEVKKEFAVERAESRADMRWMIGFNIANFVAVVGMIIQHIIR